MILEDVIIYQYFYYYHLVYDYFALVLDCILRRPNGQTALLAYLIKYTIKHNIV